MAEGAAAQVSGNVWADVAVFAALIAGSALFSGSETALTGFSRARMTALEADGNKRAGLVNRLRKKKEMMISAILLGNTFINVLASAFATSVLIRFFGDTAIALATVGVTLVLLIFSEVLPKTYALIHADRTALRIAPVIAAVMLALSPITGAVSRIVKLIFRLFRLSREGISPEAQEEELRGAIALFGGVDTAEGGHERSAMLRSILDLADVHVEEIMVHRRNVRMIDRNWPATRILDEVLHSTFTRLPVWQDTTDNIVGILHAKLLLSELRRCGGDISRVNLSNAMLEPWFIPDTTPLFDQLQQFRARREHFAIMVDEYGVYKGIITLEDILEEIVGQIDDEHDQHVPGAHAQADGSVIVEGKVTIRDLNREFGWRLPDEEYSTLAGLLLHESQRIPGVGQTFTFYNFRFEILKRQRNQIASVRVVPPNVKAAANA